MAVENEIRTAVKQVLMLGGIAIILGEIMAYVLASFITAPIKRIIGATKQLAAGNHPALLDDFGLSAAMEWQAKEFSDRTGISSYFFSRPENIVPRQDQAVALFRVFQEGLTTVARQASATQVTAGLWETSNALVMEVRDNGVGITKSQIVDSRSFGVISMHERVIRLGGELEIHGQRAQDTTLRAWIPKGDT